MGKTKTLRVWGSAPAFELDIEPTDEEIAEELANEYEEEVWDEYRLTLERDRNGNFNETLERL